MKHSALDAAGRTRLHLPQKGYAAQPRLDNLCFVIDSSYRYDGGNQGLQGGALIGATTQNHERNPYPDFFPFVIIQVKSFLAPG